MFFLRITYQEKVTIIPSAQARKLEDGRKRERLIRGGEEAGGESGGE